MDDSVSNFVIRTCRLIPKANTKVFDSLHLQVSISCEHHQIACGSSAEFFIQPIRYCVGDVDLFEIKTRALAFTDKKPEFPYEVRHNADIIDCFLMEPYPDYPSFVRLRRLGQLRYNWDRRIFELVQIGVQEVVITEKIYERERHETDQGSFKVGPARKWIDPIKGLLSVDNVTAIWCPQWPNEAKDWPRRQRKNKWPTTVKIQEVVQNGCHVVDAKHPACRSDMHQCRLSFTVAELILVQSWTQIQQIVYHMLRFFSKRELIRKGCSKEDEVLCAYHFKTLMLWSCEEMSPEWWNSLSVIKICCNLFKKLSKWLKETRCPNYFIPQANLFHDRFSREIVNETISRLNHYSNSDMLSLWFMVHYIHPGFVDVFRDVFDGKRTPDLTGCVYEHMLHSCETMKADRPKTIDNHVSLRFVLVVDCARIEVRREFKWKCSPFHQNMLRMSSAFWKESDFPPSADIESSFSFYGSMLRLLLSAYSLDCNEIHSCSEWFFEIIREISMKQKFVICRHHNIPRSLARCVSESQSYFSKAQDLMENLTGLNGDLEFKVVSEISKALLIRAFECEDSERNNIVRSILAYLAALHFAASEYQIATDLCSRVIMDEKLEIKETETLNAGCLLYIYDIIKIIGFNRIFKTATDAVLQHGPTKRQEIFLDLRLNPEVFAYYLITLSSERSICSFGLKYISQSPTYPLDAILIAILNRKSSRRLKKGYDFTRVYQRGNATKKLEAPNEGPLRSLNTIIQLLVEFSLENMTSFYDLIGRDFGFHCSTVDCYRAAYLYKCGKYAEVEHLCEKILKEPDSQNDLKELAIANVMLVPPLDNFFDRDIQCLLGLHTLVCYLLSSIEDLTERKVSEMSFQLHFTREIKSNYAAPPSLSILLNKPYHVKCHYFLGRHFLARYLKVRCLIDCNCSLIEIMSELEKLKACLPFEHVIRCFLKRKLWQFKKVLDTV